MRGGVTSVKNGGNLQADGGNLYIESDVEKISYVQAIGNTGNAVHVLIAQEAELNDVVGTGDTDGIMTFFIGDDTLFGLGIQYRSTG